MLTPVGHPVYSYTERRQMAAFTASAASKQDAKVVILGASGVGKTCIGLRFVKDQFVPYTASTIGASFLVKELSISGQ